MTRKDRTEGIYNRREVLDESERRQYCLIQLKDLLSYAYRYSEDVKKRFDRAQFNVEKFKTLSDIKHIPLLKKKELIFLQSIGPRLGGLLTKDIGELKRIFLSPGPIFDPEDRMDDYWGYTEAFYSVGFRPGVGALADALSRTGSFGADENRDGAITLTELRRRLLQSHGASTVRTYPEDSDFALFSYDLSAVSSRRRETSIEGITFSGDTLSADAPVIDFSFNVVRTAQVAYQLVYRRQGIWDFDQSTLIYDNNGDFGSYAIAGRTLSPGLKERSITLNTADAQSSGYVLLQILVIEKGLPSVVWSKVLCVPPTTSDPELRVHVQDTFCPESGEELTFVVYHGVPCEVTVTIEDEAGQTVRRLSSRQASRPEQLSAPGSTFCWNGTDSQGKLVNAGLYRVRVKAYVGTERYEVESGWISLTEMVG